MKMKWKIPKHSDLIMTDPWGFGKTMLSEEVELFEKVGKEKAELEKARKEQSELFEKARKEANKYDLHLNPDNMLKERVKWLEAENKRLEQTNDRLVERNQDLTRTLKIMMEIKSDK